MRFLFKLLALLIFGPLILGMLLVLAVVAIVGLPLLWEQITGKYSSPPEQGTTRA